MKEPDRAAESPRTKLIGLWLIGGWLAVNIASAAFQTDFWSRRCVMSVLLAYAFYYAWSRACRGAGQAGIVIINQASPRYAKIAADLAMMLLATVSVLVLLNLDDVLHRYLH